MNGFYIAATACAGTGLWLLLPHGQATARTAGAVLVAVSLGLWASQCPSFAGWAGNAVLIILAGVTLTAAVGAVTCRTPVYCALWFGLSLFGTAGLLLILAAQFLAVATLVVYAGAILVTFLFILLMAQPEGRAPYDRRSWEPLLSAATAAVIAGILTTVISTTLLPATAPDQPAQIAVAAEARAEGVLAPNHTARIGGELFGRHLIAVEVIGLVLLAALVGAAVIAMPAKPQ